MLSYAVRQLELAGRHYLLLPKLNSSQMDALAGRLEGLGRAVEAAPLLVARSPGGSVTVDPKGLCWGVLDPADLILPAVPGLLAIPREGARAGEIRGMYYRVAGMGRKTLLRLSTRVEASASWDRLRAAGDCGLSPDEHLVATRLLKPLDAPCRVVTDFIADNSLPFRVGRTTLFASDLTGSEVASTLRAGGERKARNTYLPRSGIIEIRGREIPSLPDDDLDDLGDWCSFRRTG